ncbi:hypothetical protein ALI22I_20865 [Saccharothrix sp. ALI-22-I]|uniref:Hsp70 family protein n=1 Tax=Saccharothrix sp. ALI-22-I TaxID=1933778 RepID=UPI00097BC0FF|nr:hypothetical protein ALI22I_20865 [Saccharothrix sp. ALI-22-I]
MAKAVGIDLGTTNSVIATTEGGKPTVIPNNEGARTTPSVVAFTDQGERLVGQLARRQAILNSKATIASAKRFVGRRFEEVSSEKDTVSYDVVSGPQGAARFQVRDRQYAPEEISAAVLRKLVDDASKFLGEKRLGQLGDAAPAHERARAEMLIGDARQAVKDDSVGLDRLRELTSELQQLYYGLDSAGGTATGGTAGGGGTAGAGQPGKADDDVIDAEFTSGCGRRPWPNREV